jgi:hypothetical protein
LIATFRPGTSPPPVRMPMRRVAIRKISVRSEFRVQSSAFGVPS